MEESFEFYDEVSGSHSHHVFTTVDVSSDMPELMLLWWQSKAEIIFWWWTPSVMDFAPQSNYNWSFCSKTLLTVIHIVKTKLHIRCNAGVKTTDLKGHLSGHGTVLYFPDGIANILSLSWVKEWFRVTCDSATENAFHVHKTGKKMIFKEATRCLCYFDILIEQRRVRF